MTVKVDLNYLLLIEEILLHVFDEFLPGVISDQSQWVCKFTVPFAGDAYC